MKGVGRAADALIVAQRTRRPVQLMQRIQPQPKNFALAALMSSRSGELRHLGILSQTQDLVRDKFGYAPPCPPSRMFCRTFLASKSKVGLGALVSFCQHQEPPLQWKSISVKEGNKPVLRPSTGKCSWESAGFPLRAKVLLASEEVPAQGVFSPLSCVKCL